MLQKVPWIEDLAKTLGITKFMTVVCIVLDIHSISLRKQALKDHSLHENIWRSHCFKLTKNNKKRLVSACMIWPLKNNSVTCSSSELLLNDHILTSRNISTGNFPQSNGFQCGQGPHADALWIPIRLAGKGRKLHWTEWPFALWWAGLGKGLFLGCHWLLMVVLYKASLP